MRIAKQGRIFSRHPWSPRGSGSIAPGQGSGRPNLQCDMDCLAALYDLANRNIQQVSLRVAKLMLSVTAAAQEVHDDLILGFDIGWLWSQILRVVLRQDLDVILKSL